MTGDFFGFENEDEDPRTAADWSVRPTLVLRDWVEVFLVEELLAGVVGVDIRNGLLGGGGEDCGFFGGCESVGCGEDGLVEHYS